MADKERVALNRRSAAELAGVSVRQLDYWDRTELLPPAVSERLSPGRTVRLYGYRELMSLLVIAELRRRQVSLQHIRRIVAHLKDRGYAEPLTELRYATRNDEVYFQHDDGSWASSVAVDQLVIHELLDLAPLAARIHAAGRRDPSTYGRTERRRGALGSKPLVAGTRVPVQTIEHYLTHGRETEEILEAHPVLVRQDIEAVRRRLSAA